MARCKTSETREDILEQENVREHQLTRVIVQFCLLGGLIIVAGYFLAWSSIVIVSKTGLSESVMGAYFSATVSSIPELIVAVAAVRQGALTLAVGNIVGGNSFDVLFVAFSDFGYTEGSIMHTFQAGQLLIINLSILMTAVLAMGLLDREKKGVAGIGWESVLIISLFMGGYYLLSGM